MKKLFVIIMLLICAISSNAQDEIYLKSGKILKCRIDSLSSNSKKLYFIDKKLVNQSVEISLVSSYIWNGETNKGLTNVKDKGLTNVKETTEVKKEKTGWIGSTKKVPDYIASNGIEYCIGDTIIMGIGSGHNGEFVYFQMGSFFNTLSAINGDYKNIASGLSKNYSGTPVILKKIKEQTIKGIKKTYFVVGGGNITNYNIMIEEAIASGEIKTNGMTSDNALAELKKWKDKLDLELITQDEYNKKKSELLKFIK